jgi:hypothetical protein
VSSGPAGPGPPHATLGEGNRSSFVNSGLFDASLNQEGNGPLHSVKVTRSASSILIRQYDGKRRALSSVMSFTVGFRYSELRGSGTTFGDCEGYSFLTRSPDLENASSELRACMSIREDEHEALELNGSSIIMESLERIWSWEISRSSPRIFFSSSSKTLSSLNGFICQ